MDLQSAIGKDIYAKVQLGIWSSAQPDLSKPNLNQLTKTLYPGDYVGKVTSVQMIGSDPWFIIGGGGYVHAVDSNLNFGKPATAGFGWAGGLLLALIIGGAIYKATKKKQTNTHTK